MDLIDALEIERKQWLNKLTNLKSKRMSNINNQIQIQQELIAHLNKKISDNSDWMNNHKDARYDLLRNILIDDNRGYTSQIETAQANLNNLLMQQSADTDAAKQVSGSNNDYRASLYTDFQSGTILS